MGRRRNAVAPDSAESPQTEESSGPGPHGTLTLRGSADALKKQLGAGDEKPAPPAKPVAENGQSDEKNKFVEALRNPKYIIRVKRMTPREFNGMKTNFEVWQAELPLGYQEIQEEVGKGFGGQKYRVAVIDPSSNNTIAADTFEVDGDPIVPEPDVSPEEEERIFMHGKPKSPTEVTVEGLDRRAAVTAKMLEVEALEDQLLEARKRRENSTKPAPAQDNTRVDDIERRLAEAKHQAELEARDRKHAEELRELKAMIAQNAQAKPSGAADPMMILLEQMREDRKQAQTQFTAILTQMKDDKLNLVIDEVKSLRNKPAQQQSSFLEMAEAMIKMKKLMGWDGGGDDDDDEEEGGDADDGRPWWEKALDKLGGKLGEKLFAKFTQMEEKGEHVDRESFLREMTQHADQVAEEAVRRQQKPVHALPPPPPAASAPAVAPAPAPAVALPPPPPAATPAHEAPAAIPQVPEKLTLEQEIVLRVAGVIDMLSREIELRPNEYHWNYEGAFLALPEAVLEKVCAAPDPASMIDAFAMDHINPEGLAGLKAKISGNARIQAWVKVGLDELKVWFSRKLEDPTFDPFGDEVQEEVEA